MNKTISKLTAGLALLIGMASCADQFDDPNIYNAFGNNYIPEQRTISIGELKDLHASTISNSSFAPIDEGTILKGVVIGDDESGNLYKQLIVADESGAIVISIDNTGLYANCPVGQMVAIDCTDLYIGGYGQQAQIGTMYYNSDRATYQIGRMPSFTWESHVRILNRPQTTYDELEPIVIDGAWLNANSQDDAPFLVEMHDVTIEEADGETLIAPEEDVVNSNAVERTIRFSDGETLVMRTSSYANFALDILPQGSLNITGILGRYRNTWQLTVRTLNDIEINK